MHTPQALSRRDTLHAVHAALATQRAVRIDPGDADCRVAQPAIGHIGAVVKPELPALRLCKALIHCEQIGSE